MKTAQAIAQAMNFVADKDIIGWFTGAIIMSHSIKNCY